MTLSEAIKYRFLQLLGEKGISISEASKRADISKSTLDYAIYSRGRHNYSIETVKAMAKGAGVELKEFFDSPYFENVDFV
ncbi:MAG: helix-turn-helix transcriptional regulator [Ruminococcus sp.]|nr:helix-turn-helix transcriptional regulator [Ruminococcus sp.]